MGKKTGKTLLCRRYAVALFELAEKDRLAEKVSDELAALAKLIEESPELKSAIRNPALPASGLASAIAAILEKASSSAVTQRFCTILAENRRLVFLSGILTIYNELVAEAKGEVTAEVASAAPLTPTQTKDIAANLKNFTGKQVSIIKRTDPALLAGFTVKIGSRMLDGSLAGRLSRLEQYLKHAGNG